MSREELRRRARALADELEAFEVPCERAGGRLDEAARRRADEAVRASGLAAAAIPRELGGGGLALGDQIAVAQELGRLSNCLWALVWSPANALLHADAGQRERYLVPAVRGERRDAYAVTEEEAGSDPRSIRSEARRDGDAYRLSGLKWFVTGGEAADFFLVLAWAVDGHDRQPTLFIVDRDAPGVSLAADPDYSHNAVVRHPHVAFDATPVPAANVLGGLGRGFELTAEWFVEERALVAARCVGACQRLVELGTAHALGRRQHAVRIFDHQAVSFALADCAAETVCARLLVEHVGELRDTGADAKLVHAYASMAKLVASETAGRVADRVQQVFGGRGYMRDNPAERLWRSLRLDRIWEGTSEIQRLIVARALERRGPSTLLAPPATPPR